MARVRVPDVEFFLVGAETPLGNFLGVRCAPVRGMRKIRVAGIFVGRLHFRGRPYSKMTLRIRGKDNHQLANSFGIGWELGQGWGN